MKTEEDKKLIVFENRKIRRIWYNAEWFYSIVDIVAILTESTRSRKYWSDLKIKLIEEGSELSAKIGQLKFKSSVVLLMSIQIIYLNHIQQSIYLTYQRRFLASFLF